MMSPIITEHLDAIRSVCRQHFVKVLHVFGSAAKSGMHADSDVDFLYQFDYEQIVSLSDTSFDYAINLFQMEHELEILLQKKVDLIAEEAVQNKVFRQEITISKQLLYAA